MKYLKKFSNSSEYEQFKEGEKWLTPNVSLITDNKICFPYSDDDIAGLVATASEMADLRFERSAIIFSL